MLIRYFINVPKVPRAYADQTGGVAIRSYPCKERTVLKPGEPLALVETWWAVLQVEPAMPCHIEKTLYDNPVLAGGVIKEGEPLALAFCEPEEIPKGPENAVFRLVEQKRLKPIKGDAQQPPA